MKINGWNMSPWRFGSDDFPLYMGDFFWFYVNFPGCFRGSGCGEACYHTGRKSVGVFNSKTSEVLSLMWI